jgi:hypothetical protein
MDERTGRHEGRHEGQNDRSGPPDPTRKLLKVFGVKVTDYEAKTDVLLARWTEASAADRDGIAREAAELSADLAHWLRELQTHVLERQERVLAAVAQR